MRKRWMGAAILIVGAAALYGFGIALAPWRPDPAWQSWLSFGVLLLSALLVLGGNNLGGRLAQRQRRLRSAEVEAALALPRVPQPGGRARLRPERRYKAAIALGVAAIVAGYALFGLWSLVAAPPSVWLHGVVIGAAGVVASGRPLLHGLMRLLRPTVLEVSRDGLLLDGPRPVAIAWHDVDRILLERRKGGLVLQFRLVDIAGTLARLAPLDRRLLETEWRFGHPPISINLNTLGGGVGNQLRAIAGLMPSTLPGLYVADSDVA